ncbi:MAG: HlyD family efflux transporter periplasmic adaptor subunit [Chitinophagaceae bacterium]|nr:MAG: HlyD family efflux transporter periplasmic adaptor subunit [Chitinophagaceae bacterium]
MTRAASNCCPGSSRSSLSGFNPYNTIIMVPSDFPGTDDIVLPGTKKTSIIYWILILMVACVITALPLVTVDVTVQSEGIIRPASERTALRSITGGIISRINYKEGEYITRGSVILSIRDNLSGMRIPGTTSEIGLRKSWLQDLTLLLTTDTINQKIIQRLSSPIYKAEASRYLFQSIDKSASASKAARELQVATNLWRDKVISGKEYEDKQTEFSKIKAAFEAFKNEQFSTWQTERSRITSELLQLELSKTEQVELQNRYEIRAPVSGTVLGITARYEGAAIQAGEVFCEISPDDELMAECYLQTKDVAFIKPGQQVRLRVTAFDHHFFGVLSATVERVNNDYTLVNNAPVYVVRCRLDDRELKLKNGYRGHLKKGLALQARFVVTNRKLSELLFDKVDDWLNPTT